MKVNSNTHVSTDIQSREASSKGLLFAGEVTMLA